MRKQSKKKCTGCSRAKVLLDEEDLVFTATPYILLQYIIDKDVLGAFFESDEKGFRMKRSSYCRRCARMYEEINLLEW